MAEMPDNGPFEEEAALAELERLQRELEESRRRRRQANDAFDSFLRSFGTRSSSTTESAGAVAPPPVRRRPRAPIAATPAESASKKSPELDDFPPEEVVKPFAPSATDEAVAVVPEPSGPGLESVEPTPSLALPKVTAAHHVPAALTPASQPPDRKRAALAIGGVALAGVAIFAWRMGQSGRTSDAPASVNTAVTTPPVTTPAPVPAPAPAAAVPVAELTTGRRVWVRVLVDGEKTIERELDANVRIPLTPKQRIVVRAGDAGAVRVLLAGKDQGPFGPDGVAVTRAFVVPPAPAPPR
jgi:RodZ C-terminal domain